MVPRFDFVGALLCAAALSYAQPYDHQVLLDTDNDASTGCAVAVSELGWDGTIVGIEQMLTVEVVWGQTPMVTGVSRSVCAGGAMGPPEALSPGGWPVGVGLGVGGSSVVEGSMPLALLGDAQIVRVYFHSSRGDGSDVVLGHDGDEGTPLLLRLQWPIPALGGWGRLTIATLVGLAGFVVLRRRIRHSTVGAMALIGVTVLAVGVSQAIDWDLALVSTTDPQGDSSIADAAEDIVAAFVATDQNDIHVRIDVAVTDECPNDPDKITPGQCGCGVPDTDTDGDGTADCNDGCPDDPLKTEPGVCGCGVLDTDTDGDGTPDCNDGCPDDPLKTEPGVCSCGVPDTDTDGDGTPDCNDGCPDDPLKTEPGVCGCGVPETPDCNDPVPALSGKIVINEIGCDSDPFGRSFIEVLSLVHNASDITPREMGQLSLFIVGQDGQVTNVQQGFIDDTIPADGTMVIYEDGTLEIRNKHGNIKNISSANANWADNAQIYITGTWVDYNPAIHDFSFGNTTANPLLANLLQNDSSIDYFLANSPVPDTAHSEIFDGTWYPPVGAPASEGDFASFDGSLTSATVFARVFIDVGILPFVTEPGEIDSHTAADWTTNSTPTILDGGLNPTQLSGANPHVDDGQTVFFGTEDNDTAAGEEGPDFLYGRGDDDTILGGGGDDLVSGGPGSDEIVGGPGDDLIVDTETDFNTPGGTAIIDGGEGVDIFEFTSASDTASLQLTDSAEAASRLSGIEVLDMRDGQMGDSMTITKDVVNALGDNNDHTSAVNPDSIDPVFDGKVDIYVRGENVVGSTDTLNLQGAGWSFASGAVALGPETFYIWTNSIDVDEAVIAIQSGVDVNTPP